MLLDVHYFGAAYELAIIIMTTRFVALSPREISVTVDGCSCRQQRVLIRLRLPTCKDHNNSVERFLSTLA